MPIRIDRPCHEPPEAMTGPPERRHCHRCHRDVHNLSRMTAAEAHAFVRARRVHGLCVRIDHAADGTPLFSDVVPVASLARRLVPAGLVVAIVATVTAPLSCVAYTSLGGIGGNPPERGSGRDAAPALVDAERPPPAPSSARRGRIDNS